MTFISSSFNIILGITVSLITATSMIALKDNPDLSKSDKVIGMYFDAIIIYLILVMIVGQIQLMGRT